GMPIIMRRLGVQDGSLRQIEGAVMIVQARETARYDRAAVIAAPARDDFFLGWPPEDIVVVPDDFKLRFVRVRARGAELYSLHAPWRHCQQPCAQTDGRLIRATAERVIVSELQGLLVHGIGNFSAAVSDEIAI